MCGYVCILSVYPYRPDPVTCILCQGRGMVEIEVPLEVIGSIRESPVPMWPVRTLTVGATCPVCLGDGEYSPYLLYRAVKEGWLG